MGLELASGEGLQQAATDCNVLENALDGKSLSGQQMRAAELLAIGKTLQQVCQELSIERTTLWRWRKLREFRDEVRERQQELFSTAGDRLRGMLDPALDVVEKRLADRYEPSRFRAAVTVLRLSGLSKAV